MFCPNCGNNCFDAKFCPNCGNSLNKDLINVNPVVNSAPQPKQIDVGYYVRKYTPNREAAIAALRADTGMSAIEAITAVDAIFTENGQPSFADLAKKDDKLPTKKETMAQKREELKNSGQVYCPKCLSTSITANKKGFGIGKAVAGLYVAGGLGLTAGNMGAKNVICTCLKCGYQWKAGTR